jgi:hypothetical protein
VPFTISVVIARDMCEHIRVHRVRAPPGTSTAGVRFTLRKPDDGEHSPHALARSSGSATQYGAVSEAESHLSFDSIVALIECEALVRACRAVV